VARYPEKVAKDALAAMFTTKNEFIGLGVALLMPTEFAGARRGVAVRTKRVVMSRGTYRKGWKPAGSKRERGGGEETAG